VAALLAARAVYAARDEALRIARAPLNFHHILGRKLYQFIASAYRACATAVGEVLSLLEIWRGASFADVNQQTGFGEPGKGAPHGDKATCFASHA